jgi:hypothetical protein
MCQLAIVPMSHLVGIPVNLGEDHHHRPFREKQMDQVSRVDGGPRYDRNAAGDFQPQSNCPYTNMVQIFQDSFFNICQSSGQSMESNGGKGH